MQHALLAGREQIAAKAPVLQREQRLSLISLHLTALSAAGDDFTSLQNQQNGMQNAINVTQYRNAVDLLSFPSAAAGKSGNHSEFSHSAMKIFFTDSLSSLDLTAHVRSWSSCSFDEFSVHERAGLRGLQLPEWDGTIGTEHA